MPCDSITTSVVDLGKAQPDLLEAALNSLNLRARRDGHIVYFGWNESYDAQTGQLRVNSTRDVAEIKRAYSHQVVLSQAKKFGWQIKKVSENKYAVQRR